MSLNKFMHPRNIYRKPPDFKALAIKYPEFRKHAKQDISGKVRFNFKDLEAVRVLTSTLLKEDFDLNVDIPSSRLIPTLPLRLNYLLWLEDIVQSNEAVSDTVKGVDIGCGASCVYPLLAAKHFGWHMLATEIDMDSAFMASTNVRRNKLQNMITVRSVKEGTMLDGVLAADTVYDFCMCNPPFFSSEEELDPKNVARSASRPLPRNAHSGATGELVFEGGELAFVKEIIQDSLKLKGQIRVYSVMVGHKTTVGKLRQALKEAGVSQVATTEFCQGHTTRWGVAWTLEPIVVFPQPSAATSRKITAPYSCAFDMDVASTVEKLQLLMNELQMTYSTLKSDQELLAMEITAAKNTWSNSRKKRRQEKNIQMLSNGANSSKEPTSEVAKTEEHTEIVATKSGDGNKVDHDAMEVSECNVTAVSNTTEIVTDKDDSQISNSVQDNKSVVEINDNKRKKPEDDEERCDVSNMKKAKLESSSSPQSSSSSKRDAFLCCSLIVKKVEKGSQVDVSWLRGVGGKEAAHQVLHYFKNTLETH